MTNQAPRREKEGNRNERKGGTMERRERRKGGDTNATVPTTPPVKEEGRKDKGKRNEGKTGTALNRTVSGLGDFSLSHLLAICWLGGVCSLPLSPHFSLSLSFSPSLSLSLCFSYAGWAVSSLSLFPSSLFSLFCWLGRLVPLLRWLGGACSLSLSLSGILTGGM